MLDELQRFIKATKSSDFWDRIAVAKLIGSHKTIQKPMEQQQKMDKRQNELRKYLATDYGDKVKEVMDDETFVLLSNQFKRGCDQLKNTAKSLGKI